MIQIKGIEVFSDGGKWIRRKGDSTYFRRATVLKGETSDSFEEVDALPDPDVQQAIVEKLRQITDYDTSPAVNSFKSVYCFTRSTHFSVFTTCSLAVSSWELSAVILASSCSCSS